MKIIEKTTRVLAQACEGSPIATTVVIGLFYLMFNLLEGQIERLIYGARFEHFMDPIFTLLFIIYSAYAVYMCAVYNNSLES